LLREKNIRLLVKRLDLISSDLSGNKWFKLKYNLKEAKKQHHKLLLTFGGAFSNHIYATAAGAHIHGISSIGIIRGEETQPLNPTLSAVLKLGMKLRYLSRSDYRNKESPGFVEHLKEKYGNFYLIPEGGTNSLAIEGTKEILGDEDLKADIICTSIGTGGTLAGLLATAHAGQKVVGFSALKGEFIHQEVHRLLQRHYILPVCTFDIFHQYHFGGYAKYSEELIRFMMDFTYRTGIPLDPIYTGKMMYGIMDAIQKDIIPQGSTVLAVHTGGLQGISGFNTIHGTKLPLS
jgi:1-aminocyclopropane-1-carboxylate deaminase